MKIARHIFLITGIIPATVLLFFTLTILPNILHGFHFELRETLILLGCLLGLGGYAGLLRMFGSHAAGKWRLTAVLLLGGAAGTILFTAAEGGRRGLRWLLLIEEPGEWFLFAWPAVVSLVFAAMLLFNRLSKHKHA